MPVTRPESRKIELCTNLEVPSASLEVPSANRSGRLSSGSASDFEGLKIVHFFRENLASAGSS